MLIFTTYDTCSRLNIMYNKNTIIFNLSSFKSGFSRLNISPPYMCTSLDDNLFDKAYAEYLLMNDNIFMELMKIVEPYFNGLDIIVLVSMGTGWDRITESLQKFLQQRYNIISYIIEDPEDLECIEIHQINVNGIYNFCEDNKRLLQLYSNVCAPKEGVVYGQYDKNNIT